MKNKFTEPAVVHIVDDNPAVRDAICWLVEQVGLVGRKYAAAAEFLNICQPGMRGCLVLDVRMPGMSGLDLQDSLQTKQVNLPIIVITGHGDVPITVRAMKAGAFEFLQKPFNDQAMLDAIHAGLEKYGAIWEQEGRANRVQESLTALTPREKEVLAHLGHGKASKVVAYDMGLSVRTVEGYRSSIMRKLGVRTVGELIEIVLKARLDY